VGARGTGWEARLDTWHDEYRRDRRALILRCHPPVRVLARQAAGRFRGVWAGKGPPDYAGVVGGRAVCFDAKDSRAARWPFSALAVHQAKDLSATEVNGGVAFIALRLRGAPSVLLWRELGPDWWAWRQGESSVASCPGGIPMAEDGWITCI